MLPHMRFMERIWTQVASMVTLLAGVPVHQIRSKIGFPLMGEKPRHL